MFALIERGRNSYGEAAILQAMRERANSGEELQSYNFFGSQLKTKSRLQTIPGV